MNTSNSISSCLIKTMFLGAVCCAVGGFLGCSAMAVFGFPLIAQLGFNVGLLGALILFVLGVVSIVGYLFCRVGAK